MVKNRIAVCVSIPVSVLRRIDKIRGDTPRSRFIGQLCEMAVDSPAYRETEEEAQYE